MEKNKFLIVIILIIFVTVTSIITYNTVYANLQQSEIIEQKEKVITDDEKSFYSVTETKMESYSVKQVPEINTKSEELLDIFDKEISNIDSINKIYDSSLDREATRIITDNTIVDINEEGDIVSYKNLDDYSTVDKDKRDYAEGKAIAEINYIVDEESDLENVISSIEEINNLEDYELIDCSNSIEGCWILTWCKSYENGLINSYETVNVVVDAKDGSIMLYGKNEGEPNSIEPSINENDAINYAINIISEYDNYDEITTDLTFYKIDTEDEENNIRLTWKISIDGKEFIYVDAITGNILGEDSTQSTDYARSMSVSPDIDGYENRANWASEAFTRLGYNQTGYETVTWRISQTDIDWVLSRSNLYGLYLCCHGGYYGSYSSLTDNSNWRILSTTNYGNWHFVYLDACYSSVNNNWANSFGATSSGRCFVGWNVPVYKVTAYDFAQRFFPRLGYMSVYDAVVTSLWESRNAGYNVEGGNICDPGFAGDSNYYGWAW